MVVRQAFLSLGSASSYSGFLYNRAHGFRGLCAMASIASSLQPPSIVDIDQRVRDLCMHRRLKEALFLVYQCDGRVSSYAIAYLLRTCSAMNAFCEAKFVHFHMMNSGFDENILLTNMIMRTYDECGSLRDAWVLFYIMRQRTIVSWNIIIGAYAKHGFRDEVFCLLCELLHQDSVKPDVVTCVSVLSVCTNPLFFTDVKLVYGFVVELSLEADVTVGNVLINMYSHSGTLIDAVKIFEKLPEKNVITWNTLIAACAIPGHEYSSFDLFEKMHYQGIPREKATFVSTLNACANPSELLIGKLVHFEITDNDLHSEILVATALVKMYGRCASLVDACSVFESMMHTRDVVLWTTMIATYIQQGQSRQALQVYHEMRQEGVKPNNITHVTILTACMTPGALMDGKMIRKCIPDKEIESDIILGNALITMYQKCGSFVDAENLFYGMPRKDVVSCTAIIAAYAEQGRGYDALFLYEKMGKMGIQPDRFTFSGILDACASVAALSEGRLVYHTVMEHGVDWDGIIGNALVSLFGECGIVEDAHHVFSKLPGQDWVSWSAIIAAYANHGYCQEAFKLFEDMQQDGIKPTIVTFVSLLCACSHAGLLNDGYLCFISMTRDHGTTPTLEHFMCLIDVISRAGCIHETEELMNKMPLQPSALLWNTFLGACRVHDMVDEGHRAATYTLELDSQNEAPYLLLSQLCASASRLEDTF